MDLRFTSLGMGDSLYSRAGNLCSWGAVSPPTRIGVEVSAPTDSLGICRRGADSNSADDTRRPTTVFAVHANSVVSDGRLSRIRNLDLRSWRDTAPVAPIHDKLPREYP